MFFARNIFSPTFCLQRHISQVLNIIWLIFLGPSCCVHSYLDRVGIDGTVVIQMQMMTMLKNNWNPLQRIKASNDDFTEKWGFHMKMRLFLFKRLSSKYPQKDRSRQSAQLELQLNFWTICEWISSFERFFLGQQLILWGFGCHQSFRMSDTTPLQEISHVFQKVSFIWTRT